VLTAAHCVVPTLARGSRVVVGSSVTSPVASASIAASRAHPAFDRGTLADDAALLVLAEALPIAPVLLGPSAPVVGSDVTVVGWGETTGDAGDYGAKRVGTAIVTGVDASTFQVAPHPSQPCAGDSGGPAFMTTGGVESVVGITSHGDDACSTHATYTRVDAVTADFVSPTLAALGPGTASLGERCLYAEQCSNGTGACVAALDEPDLSYCTAACAVNADCPSGMLCVSVLAGGSQCRYLRPTPGAFGGRCGADSDCLEGVCEASTCTLRCAPSGDTCPNGATCAELGNGIDFFCVAPPPSVSGSSCAAGSSPDGSASGWLAAAVWAAVLGARRRRT
jgi:MYXO-CTERM domain-containing protein